jgi:membrane fusion protein (multidrug efflux system)
VKIGLGILAALALGAAVLIGVRHLRYALAHAETDDAQVEGDISPVLPRVSGYVTRVLVRDNERVEAGQPLLEIDARELDLKIAAAAAALKSAEAARETARAGLANARAAEAVAQADERVAAVTEAKTASDLKRDTALFDTNAITDRQLTDTRAAADVASAQREASRRQAEAAGAAVGVAAAQANAAQSQIEARQADLDYARLERSYATVTAPMAGEVSHKNVEPGQYVEAGQTLLSVASDADVWVVANFKETQLAGMRPGQPVDVAVDSFPGRLFHGRVESLAGATGARFALLPPDNASGNYIKVTQRVPVKIVITDPPDAEPRLRPGMSVDAAVLVRD